MLWEGGWQLRWVQGRGEGESVGRQRRSRGKGVLVRSGRFHLGRSAPEEAGRCQNVDKHLLVRCGDSEKKT